MIISPPLLKAKDAHETDAAWIERVMTAGKDHEKYVFHTANRMFIEQ